jgi:membrane associated rhomboid family serine protease
MMGLYRIGGDLECMFGPWKVRPWPSLRCSPSPSVSSHPPPPPQVGFLYFTAGLYAALASAVFLPNSVGVGASGAIYGLLGASVAEFLINWSQYDDKCKTALSLLLAMVRGTLPLACCPCCWPW